MTSSMKPPIAPNSESISTVFSSAHCASIMPAELRHNHHPRPSMATYCVRPGLAAGLSTDSLPDAAPRRHGMLLLRRTLLPLHHPTGTCRLLPPHLLLRADRRTARLSRPEL